MWYPFLSPHYCDVIMGAIASTITSFAIVYSTVYSDVDQRKHQSSASLAFVWGIPRWPVNSPHKWPVTRKMFPFDDVILRWISLDLNDKKSTLVQVMDWCRQTASHYLSQCWPSYMSPYVRGIHRWIPLTKASDAKLWCFFDLRLNKRLSTQM